jgi:hypothetical protein
VVAPAAPIASWVTPPSAPAGVVSVSPVACIAATDSTPASAMPSAANAGWTAKPYQPTTITPAAAIASAIVTRAPARVARMAPTSARRSRITPRARPVSEPAIISAAPGHNVQPTAAA